MGVRIPTPASFPKETPEMAAIRAQRAFDLMQREKAQGEPIVDAELTRADARPRAEGTPRSDVAGPRRVQFQGTVHEFPGDATDDEIASALDSLAPQAPRPSQADVRAAEPQPTPIASQKEKEDRFKDARLRYIQATGGTIPPGKSIDDAVEQWSGIQNPIKTREKAETDELAAGGELQYGDTVPYVASKALAAMGGFAVGGPTGATAGESAVRFTSLAFNLKKAVDAGAIDQDRAAEIMAKEMLRGSAGDAAVNFGLPLLGQIVMKMPGMGWLAEKTAALIGAGSPTKELAAQRARALGKLMEKAPSPAARKAVEELGNRTDDVIPTPGQVTGDASLAEQAARVVNPAKFDKANVKLAEVANGMRDDLVNPAVQPSAKTLGETITTVATDTEKRMKDRLRPTFDAADNLGVKVDFEDVLAKAKSALARDASVPGKRLADGERAGIEELIANLEGTSQNGLSRNTQVSPEAALDFISRQKEKLRATTADYKPSKYFETVVDQLNTAADTAYARAAANAGKGDVLRDLLKARDDYRGFMDTVYEDAVKQALRKNPEDVGKLFWQAGNVSEIEQLQKLLGIAMREGAMSRGQATKLSRDMVRGFMQEAVPDLGAAAKWSETLDAKPGLRRTWETLTAQPGGSQLRGAMEVLEEAAKIAQREHKDLVGGLGLAAIPISRAAGGGVGVSLVTGAFHPAMMVAGLSVDALARMMATAYTQGNKGVLNATMRALRANSAGTATGAKAFQAALAEMRKFAADNDLEDPVVEQQ